MMLNKIFTFHYQLDHNTGRNVKFVINTNRQPKRLTNRRHHRRSEQPFHLHQVYPGVTPLMMLG